MTGTHPFSNKRNSASHNLNFNAPSSPIPYVPSVSLAAVIVVLACGFGRREVVSFGGVSAGSWPFDLINCANFDSHEPLLSESSMSIVLLDL